MSIREAALVVLAGVATVALMFGVACGGSDDPPERNARDRDERRAERATRRASEESQPAPATPVTSSGVEPTAPTRAEPTVDPSNPFGSLIATPEPATATLEVVPTEVSTPAPAEPQIVEVTKEVVKEVVKEVPKAATPTQVPVPVPTARPQQVPVFVATATTPSKAPVFVATATPATPAKVPTPLLHKAVLEGNQAEVDRLLNLGEDVNVTDDEGRTPLYLATEQDNPEIAALLLSWDAHLAAPRQWELLHVAAAADSTEMVGLLLDRGSEIESPVCGSWMPLYLTVVQANPNIEGKDVESALGARYTREVECGGVYQEGSDGIAVFGGQLDTPTIVAGWRALHFAVIASHTEMIVLLLDRGANIEARDHTLMTPLHMAVAWSDGTEMTALLLDRGANIDAVAPGWSWTPLHWAVRENRPEIATMLLDRGADAQAKDNGGQTPCQMARELDRFTLTPLLGRLCRP